MPHTCTWISDLVTHKPDAIIAWIRLGLADRSSIPSHDGRLHPHGRANRLKPEIGWSSANRELAIRDIVEHVAFSRIRLAPGILVRTDIGSFAKIGRTRILCGVEVVDLNPDSVRHAVVVVAAMVVGIRWEGSGEGIDPGARADAVLVAIQP